MTKCPLITQSSAKRLAAAAIGDAKVRRGWSNADAADALGVSRGTIRNRLEDDNVNNQMTVFELLRSLQSDGVHIANRIMADTDYEVVPKCCTGAPDAIVMAGAQARCAAEIIAAAADGTVTRDEWRILLPIVTRAQADLAGLAAAGRAIVAGSG